MNADLQPKSRRQTMRHVAEVVGLIARGRFNFGYCPVCRKPTLFIRRGEWLRDLYLCVLCRSIPRQRALMQALERHFPDWRQLAVYESSPDGAASKTLRRCCRHYTASQYWPDVPPGEVRDGLRCENLEALTFDDESFDLVITQDVFEHVLDPDAGFREVARVLKPRGAHVFTVPLYPGRRTKTRARATEHGIEHLAPPEYHRNPVDPNGSLVVTEWGGDIAKRIVQASGMRTVVHEFHNPRHGLAGEFLNLCVSRKD
jgi:SAM-dependent methyltransferase